MWMLIRKINKIKIIWTGNDYTTQIGQSVDFSKDKTHKEEPRLQNKTGNDQQKIQTMTQLPLMVLVFVSLYVVTPVPPV